MLAALVPCPSCARHVRVLEEACPFCGNPFTAMPIARAFATTPPLSGRLSRAAMVLAGATALAGCGKEPTIVDPAPKPTSTDNAPMAVLYGGPPIDSPDAAPTAISVPAYGAPPPAAPDAAPPKVAKDAGAKK
jgi:hypothetical protein